MQRHAQLGTRSLLNKRLQQRTRTATDLVLVIFLVCCELVAVFDLVALPFVQAPNRTEVTISVQIWLYSEGPLAILITRRPDTAP